MKIPRRDKLKIYGDLLSILYAESKKEKIVITRIQQQTNLPFNRLKTYIQELKDLNFIEDEVSFKLTQKGKNFLQEYQGFLDFMERMGLTY
jgi:predicted transcriptional regulator